MIPKKLHYCWFGGAEKPELIVQCMESWKKNLPDWEIIEWNETNFDIDAYPFARQAYDQKKWAFVSDVARLVVLHEYGGVYVDTDVEFYANDPFSEYVSYDNIIVFETERSIATGLCFGAQKGSVFVQKLLEPYLNTDFVFETSTVNSFFNKPIIQELYPTLEWNGKTQVIDNTIIVGADEYHTRMRHHGTRTWADLPKYRISKCHRLKKFLRNPKFFSWLEKRKILRKLVPVYEFLVYDFLDLGPIYYIKYIAMKMRRKK